MRRFYGDTDGDDGLLAGPPPAVRAVSRSAPARPRWGRLYGALIAVFALGISAHFLIPDPALRRISDGAVILLLLGVVGGWLSRNRIAMARAEEPDAGVGKPSIRIVRSRRR